MEKALTLCFVAFSDGQPVPTVPENALASADRPIFLVDPPPGKNTSAIDLPQDATVRR
jgi:hypothetical protein